MLTLFKHALSLVCLISISVATAATNPLSKIVITSTNATCVKDQSNQGSFLFTYHDNVRVTFADQSTVTSDSLEIIIDSKQQPKPDESNAEAHKPSSLSHFKRISFNNNVCFTSAHRTATAQTAYFYLHDQRCILEGNVKISQTKRNPKDVPITIDSQKAELNLATNQLTMHGTQQQPVSTTILLTGHPALQKREKKSKKKTQHAHHANTTKNTSTTSS